MGKIGKWVFSAGKIAYFIQKLFIPYTNMDTINRIPFEILKTTFANILIQRGFEAQKAKICAELFAMASLDGVASHGLNRFRRF